MLDCLKDRTPSVSASVDELYRKCAEIENTSIASYIYLCRVSGNTVNDFVLGSIISAVHVYGVRLVVVLGHTRCGMVARAIQHWAKHEHKKAQESLSAASTQASPSSPCIIGGHLERC